MSSMFGVSGSNNTNWFNSMLGTSSAQSTASGTGSLSSLLSDWSMIKNGTYYKLAKAYYAKVDASSSDTKAQTAEKQALTEAKGNAQTVQKAAEALKTTGTDSVFTRKTVVDEQTGAVTSEYDTDRIYSAVKDYVDSYNSVVKNTIDSDTVSVLQKTLDMVKTTKTNENLLKNIGITIASDNTLSLSEEAFKKADMTDVRSLFNGTNSLSDRIGQKASELNTLSANALNSIAKGTYSASGSYNTMSSMVGSMYDGTL